MNVQEKGAGTLGRAAALRVLRTRGSRPIFLGSSGNSGERGARGTDVRREHSVAPSRPPRMGRRSVAVGGSPRNTEAKTLSPSGASVAFSPNSPAPRWGSGTLARCDRGLRPRLLTHAPYGAENSISGRARPMNGQSADRHEKSPRNSRKNPLLGQNSPTSGGSADNSSIRSGGNPKPEDWLARHPRFADPLPRMHWCFERSSTRTGSRFAARVDQPAPSPLARSRPPRG